MEIQKLNNNAVQQIIDAFTERLLDGSLKPGDQIPTEVELAERFGVARNTVREAIKILVAMGVLEIRRPVGTFVCSGFSEAMISPMLYGVILGRGDSYGELMDLREIMETGTMLMVIRNASDGEIAALEGPLAVLREVCLCKRPQIRKVFEADDRFHEEMMRLAHNRIVEQIARTVRTMTYDMRMESVKLMLGEDRGEELYLAHEKLLNLLRTRNVTGVYSEIKSTYFVPGADGSVAPLEEKES